jgi:hypothetical protein
MTKSKPFNLKKQLPIALVVVGMLGLVWAKPADAQQIQAKVSMNTEKLLQEARDKLVSLPDQLARYINEYDWLQAQSRYPIEVQVDIYVERAEPTSFEDRYEARLVIGNKGDFQESDKRWKFPYQQGSQFTHADQFSALTGVIDFYLYMLLGGEFDKSTKLGGTDYYAKAYQVAQLSKFSEFFQWGWKERLAHIEKIRSDAYLPYRELRYFFVQARNNLRVDNRKAAEQYLRVVLIRLKSLNPEDEATQRFYELNSLDLARLLAAFEFRSQLQEMTAQDTAHAATYQEAFKQLGP